MSASGVKYVEIVIFSNSNSKHQCFKKFCNHCNKKLPPGHFCHVAPLKPSDVQVIVLFLRYGVTQFLEKRYGSFKRIPKLTCAQEICSKCEAIDDLLSSMHSVKILSIRNARTL